MFVLGLYLCSTSCYDLWASHLWQYIWKLIIIYFKEVSCSTLPKFHHMWEASKKRVCCNTWIKRQIIATFLPNGKPCSDSDTLRTVLKKFNNVKENWLCYFCPNWELSPSGILLESRFQDVMGKPVFFHIIDYLLSWKGQVCIVVLGFLILFSSMG